MNSVKKLLVLTVSSIAIASHAGAIEIDNETTVPVQTSTANAGNPDDITITADGSIEVSDSSGFTAVTINSSNDVAIDGLIQTEDSNDSTGVLINPGFNTNLTLTGDISLIEDYERTDQDDDEDDDGPVAMGNNRTAIQLGSGGSMTGNVRLDRGSAIIVEGNNSAGVLLEGTLNGDLISYGGISVTGQNAQGVTAQETINGDVEFRGTVVANGENATGVRLDGGATGAVSVSGAITATGFVNPSVSNYVPPANVTEDTPPLEERLDPDELLVGGPAFSVGGSLGQGLLINGAVADPDPSDDESEDETKDTIEDFNENRTRGNITSFGSAPALLIQAGPDGTVGEDLVLGGVVETVRDTLDDDDDDNIDEVLTEFEYDYGLINRGTITGAGTNVGFDGIGVLLEGSAGSDRSVIINGGIQNAGTISASAAEANATALRVGTRTETPRLVNSGTIQAGIATQTAANVIAVDISAGATLPELENSGTIFARSTGNAGEVAAVRDLSGTLNSIINTGSVSAGYAADGVAPSVRTDAIAFDLRANTAGVILDQFERTPTHDANNDGTVDSRDVVDPSIIGAILFGSGNDLLSLRAGTVSGDIDFGAGSDELVSSNTSIVGDVSFSGSSAVVRLQAGSRLTGDVQFGSTGTSNFVLSGGSTYSGLITNAGSALSMTVDNSRAELASGTALNLSNLAIQNGATLVVEIDQLSAQTAPILSVSGTASLTGDVRISPVFESVTNAAATITIIDAGDIIADLQSGDVSLIGETPFLYQTDLQLADGARDQLNLVYRLKTTDELGFDVNQTAAFDAVLELFDSLDPLSKSFADISSEDTFYQAYNQLLPQRTDASTRFLRAQATSTFGAVADQMNVLKASDAEGIRAWIQESFTVTDIDKSEGVPGYNGDGFSLAGGLDIPVPLFDAFGVMATFSRGEFEEKTGGNKPVSTASTGIGIYALKSWDKTFLRGTAQASSVSFESNRELNIIAGRPDNLPGGDGAERPDFSDTISASWKGESYAATVSAGHQFQAGRFYARPEISADYFSLSQDAYREEGLRNDGLGLDISAAETERASAAALLAIGIDLYPNNTTVRVVPEARIGYRHELIDSPYEATAQFIDGDETFVIRSQEEFDDAVVAGFSFNSSTNIFSARLSYDAEFSSAGTIHYIGASGVLSF